jgi:hypothetical protein
MLKFQKIYMPRHSLSRNQTFSFQIVWVCRTLLLPYKENYEKSIFLKFRDTTIATSLLRLIVQLVLAWLVMACLGLSWLVLSWLVLFWLVLACLGLSWLVLACLGLIWLGRKVCVVVVVGGGGGGGG